MELIQLVRVTDIPILLHSSTEFELYLSFLVHFIHRPCSQLEDTKLADTY